MASIFMLLGVGRWLDEDSANFYDGGPHSVPVRRIVTENSVMNTSENISIQQAPTLAALFRERVAKTPDATAYVQYDATQETWQQYSWLETAHEVARWQQAIRNTGLKRGDRLVIMCHNSWQWVICDQAAFGLGMVVVPVFMNDRPDNIAWILNDSGASLLVLESQEQWDALLSVEDQLAALKQIISLTPLKNTHDKVMALDDWLPDNAGDLATDESDPDELATIVYTSGTTGKPKGVMLSHHNILWNIHACLQLFYVASDNLMLSFLPLSHTFERTVGYYLAMVCGASTAYNRSIPQLSEDLLKLKPTVLISVPRIFERIYGRIMDKLNTEPAIKKKLFIAAVNMGWKKFEYEQGRGSWSPGLLLHPLLDHLVGRKVRQKLGGRLRFTVCGGAALSPDVARLFIGLGIPVQQGYGLTETSPIITANPLQNNQPDSVGIALPGIEVKLGEQDELLTRSPSVMLGYWNNPRTTSELIDADGWLHTGDQASIDDTGHIRITGRLKEIIVLTNGEKVPPTDMENAILLDSLIEQAMILGEGLPYLTALIAPNPDGFRKHAELLGLNPENPESYTDPRLRKIFLEHAQAQLAHFPGYAKLRGLVILQEPMTPENGLLTPTLKLKRSRILTHYAKEVKDLYNGHRNNLV
jgi:long-chain acyl-CoA synthetase